MRIKLGSGYVIHIPEEEIIEMVMENGLQGGNFTESNEIIITDVGYDHKDGLILLTVDMFKRMDS